MQPYSNGFIFQLNLLSAIVLMTISLGMFLRKDNAKPNVFLGILMGYPAMSILLNIVFIIFAQHRWLFLAPMSIGFNLTFGPVLLTYLHLIQGKSGRAPASKLVHFVPAICVFMSAGYYLAIPEGNQIELLRAVLSGESLYINLINIFLLIHLGVYLYVAWKQVGVYAEGASDFGTPPIENSVKWQKSLLRVIVAINVLLLLGYALPIALTGKAHIYSDLIVTPVTALLLYSFMLYKGLRYHVIYNRDEYSAFAAVAEPLHEFIAERRDHDEHHLQQPVYQEALVADTKVRLARLLEERKVFTKAGLKLHDVAELLDVSPAMLSFVINKHLDMTFFELLGAYRVAEAKRLLVGPDYSHYKIEYIGELAGFNSRASFYSVFKKQAGMTPQAYRDERGVGLGASTKSSG